MQPRVSKVLEPRHKDYEKEIFRSSRSRNYHAANSSIQELKRELAELEAVVEAAKDVLDDDRIFRDDSHKAASVVEGSPLNGKFTPIPWPTLIIRYYTRSNKRVLALFTCLSLPHANPFIHWT
jgi:hypothetical protein